MLTSIFLFCLTSHQYSHHCFQSDLQEFNDYLRTYNKSYDNRSEYLYRAGVYFENVDYINSQNTMGNSYTLGVNQFADYTWDEFQGLFLGYAGETKFYDNYRSYRGGVYHNLTIVNNPRDSIDWRAQGLVTDIKNQKQCGSCWAFSAVATMEGAEARKSGNLTSLSEQDLVDCVPDCYGCDGGWPFMAIDWVINGTVPSFTNSSNLSMIDTESSYPYVGTDGTCKFNVSGRGANITGLVEIPMGSVEHLQDALLTVGPISVAIDVEYDFQFYKTGVFETQKCSINHLDHAVTAVGFGKTADGRKYYIIKNSWGTSWGQDGYIYYSAEIPNMCGIAEDACYAI